MRVLLLGIDGYLGWPTAMYLSKKGHIVAGVDNFNKRKWELEVGAKPLIPIPTLHERVRVWKEVSGKNIELYIGDLTNEKFVNKTLESFVPDCIIHYGEQPSAPYSMLGNHQASITQSNNVVGTINILYSMMRHCPEAHLIKLGTLGEYGTPNIEIQEGYINIKHKGKEDTLLFPKSPGSMYHLSKVHDTNNIYFACKNWGIRATDLNQGVVWGLDTQETRLHEKLNTSLHYDEIWGTCLNRFCVQAVVGHSLTPYGKGGQTRGYLNINDTLRCVELSMRNPPDFGKLEIYNQLTEVFSVNRLAEIVRDCSSKIGLDVTIKNVSNPRKELEEHEYNIVYTKLLDLGLKPKKLSDLLIEDMLKKIIRHKNNIDVDTILLGVRWNHSE